MFHIGLCHRNEEITTRLLVSSHHVILLIDGVNHIICKLCCSWKARLLLLKCFDNKMVLVSFVWSSLHWPSSRCLTNNNKKKLIEAWKATHVDSYPVQLETFNPSRVNSGRTVRPGTRKLWKDEAKTSAAKISFSRDTAKLWNNAPTDITSAISLNCAKREIKKYCKSLVL